MGVRSWVCYNGWCKTLKENWVILTWKVESLAELNFDPGFREIGEYLSEINLNSSQLESKYITRNPGSNFSSTSDSTFQVKMTAFIFQYIWQAGFLSPPKERKLQDWICLQMIDRKEKAIDALLLINW